MKTLKTKEDFISAVGLRVFRDNSLCLCPSCEDVFKNGIVVKDEQHAQYLFDIQNEFAAEGIHLNFRLVR